MPVGDSTGVPCVQASMRAYAFKMAVSCTGSAGKSLSTRSSSVFFLLPHRRFSAMARISPMHTTEVKEIAAGSPRSNSSYAQRAQGAFRVSPRSMFVSSKKRRIERGDQSSSASNSSIGSSPGQVPQSTMGSTWRRTLTEGLLKGASRPTMSASGILSKMASPSAHALMRLASITRGWPLDLKCTSPCTVASLPHRGLSNSMSSELRCKRPGTDLPLCIKSRKRPIPCPISSSRPLITKARGTGMRLRRSSIWAQAVALKTNPVRAGFSGRNSYRTADVSAALPSPRISLSTEVS